MADSCLGRLRCLHPQPHWAGELNRALVCLYGPAGRRVCSNLNSSTSRASSRFWADCRLVDGNGPGRSFEKLQGLGAISAQIRIAPWSLLWLSYKARGSMISAESCWKPQRGKGQKSRNSFSSNPEVFAPHWTLYVILPRTCEGAWLELKAALLHAQVPSDASKYLDWCRLRPQSRSFASPAGVCSMDPRLRWSVSGSG